MNKIVNYFTITQEIPSANCSKIRLTCFDFFIFIFAEKSDSS